ncbi:MAG: DUF2341 domain-containing protein, partial [Rhodobacterales bacterium]|nr:DUF2341 domain-containing protein [Rhodobacterales bacterium]
MATLSLALLFLCGPAQAQTWWDGQWNSRATLTFNNGNQNDPLVDFPVLVVLRDGVNFDHTATAADGDDLRFIDDDGVTELAYEIESWNASGVSHIWVNVPQVDGNSNADHVWMYFDNPGAPVGEDVANPWRNSYVSVFHFAGNGGDSSTPTHNGSDQNTNDTAGMIARGRDFDGTDDQIILANESSFDFQAAITISMWAKLDAFGGGDWDALISKGDETWRLARCGGGNTLAWSTNFATGDDTNRNNCGNVVVDDGVWRYVTGVYDSSAGFKTMYINGAVDVQVGEIRQLDTNSDAVWVGNNKDHTYRSIAGQIDEVRIEGVAHSADWVAADYLSVTDTFVTWCSPWVGDADGDGMCDADDQCPGVDDFLDTDGDGVGDCVDICPFDNPDDTDGDGVCDSVDPCPLDNPDDADGDFICDTDDVCPGANDLTDTDGDGTPDCLDTCPLDNPNDTDGDGICDTDDA